ncbi:prohormone-2-like [Neodiprion fabricii]|uniref:prohormone-2-like n=1 Tax=Neodiprion fabricii TaxID=2872261 RepID=UPI001ED8D7DD|nr:prohormone-2-like [Neodiprion fabricii]
MVSAWLGILAIGLLALMTDALSTTLMEDVQRADQALRPKVKRAQELLMFGNQQNRQAENAPGNLFSPTAEKRTIGSSGLEEIKSAFPATEKFSRTKPLASAMHEAYQEKHLPTYYKGYQYGKILDNQLEDNPRNWLEDNTRTWDVSAYPRYYSVGDDRRKRSDGGFSSTPASTHAPMQSTSSPPATEMPQQPVAQAKRSLPLYQESRYKRELDPQDVLALLSLWEAERREGNWPAYDTDEYENGDDENSIVDVDEEDPRNGAAWLEGPIYSPRHFSVGNDALASSDIGIPRSRPANYYDRYGNQFGQQYGGALYGTPQYGTGYTRNDYNPDKRFMVSKRRSQAYRPYDGRKAMVNLAELLRALPQNYGSYPNDRAESSYYHRINL